MRSRDPSSPGVKRRVGMGLLLMLFASGLQARDWPTLPVPPMSELSWVARDMHYNGMHLRVAKLHSRLLPVRVLTFFRERWAEPQYVDNKKVPGYIESKAGPWSIISRVENDYLIAVQLRKDGSGETTGLISVNDLRQRPGKPGKGFPMMQGSQVVNDLPSQDAGRQARTLLLTNTFTVRSNADFYRKTYRREGWNVVMDRQSDAGNGHILTLKGGRGLASFFIQSMGKQTYVVVNVQENGLIP